MTLDNYLLFDPQCCDAVGYLEMGLRCATDGGCYDALRPLGVAYWFSLPYRLGIAPEWLIALHGFLLLLSVLLAALAMHVWWLRLHRADGSHSTRTLPVFLFSSLLAHAVWFYPLLRLSLSDMPASLMVLIAIWLLCLSQDRPRLLLQCLAGLCMGIACSLRVFFLYPLLGMLAFWMLLALIQSVKRVPATVRQPVLGITVLAALSALMPVCLQYYATFKQSGVVSYLDARWAAHWSGRHLDDAASGYDTASFAPYRWYQSPCGGTAKSLSLSVAERDPVALACLVMGRLYFYLGSYSSTVFHYGDHDNLLPPPALADPLQLTTTWQYHGLQLEPAESEVSEFQQLLLDFLTKCGQMPVPDQVCLSASLSEGMVPLGLSSSEGEGYIEAKLRLPAKQGITFSAVVMAQNTMQLALSILDENHKVVVSQSFHANTVPAFVSVTGVPQSSVPYHLRISRVSAGTSNQPLVVLWGIRAEQGGAPATLQNTSLGEEKIRYWSPWLSVINGCFFVIGLIAVWRLRALLCPAEWAALFFVSLSVGLSVVIVPEQRFFVVPMVVFCTLATLGVVDACSTILSRQRAYA